MKILFLQDVPRVGRRNEVKDIADGYARNFLLPRKLAIIATPEVLAQHKKNQSQERALHDVHDALAARNLSDLASRHIEIHARASSGGNLFAGIGAREIADQIKKTAGIDIHPHDIKLSHPIKTLGTFEVPIQIGKNSGTVCVVVLSEL